jgi:hypothetical protein
MPSSSAIDRIIEPALEKVIKNHPGGYFYKSEIAAEVLKHRTLAQVIANLAAVFEARWQLDEVLKAHVNARISEALRVRDSNKLRIYECYGAGESERRWLPLRALTAANLRVILRETKTQERQLNIKSAGYEHFLRELEKLGPAATVNDVYDLVAPEIVAMHSRG